MVNSRLALGDLWGPLVILGMLYNCLKIFEGLFGLFERKNVKKMTKNKFRKKYFKNIRKPNEKYQ